MDALARKRYAALAKELRSIAQNDHMMPNGRGYFALGRILLSTAEAVELELAVDATFTDFPLIDGPGG